MFNSLKEKFKGESPNKKNEDIQGFICPLCMKSFGSPELVQEHFDSAHPENSESIAPPPVKQIESLTSPTSQRKESIRNIQDNFNDLQQSLDEEKWYSQELKKEVDRLSILLKENEEERKNLDTHWNKKLSENKSVNLNMTDDIRKLQISKDSLLEENKLIRSDFGKLEQKYARQENKIKQLEESLELERASKCSLNSELERVKVEGFESESQEYQKQIKQLNNEIVKLQESQQTSITSLENETSNQIAKIDQLTNENTKLKETSQQLRDQIQFMSKSTNEQQTVTKSELQGKNDLISKLEMELTQEKEKVVNLTMDLSRTSTQLEYSNKESHNLTQTLSSNEVKLHEAEKKYSMEQEETSTLKEKISSLEKDLQSTTVQLTSVQTEKELIQSQVQMTDAANLVVEQIQKEKQDLATKLDEIQRDHEQKKTKLTEELAELKEHERQVNEDKYQLEKILEAKKKDEENRSHEMTALNKKNEELVKMLEEKDQKLTNSESRIIDLKSDLSKVNLEFDSVSKSSRSQLEELEEDNAKISKKLKEVDEELQSKHSEIDRINQESTVTISQYSKQIEELTGNIEKLNNELLDLQKSLQTVELEKENNSKEYHEQKSKLITDLEKAETALKEKENSNQELLAEIEKAQQTNISLNQTVSDSYRDNETLNNQIKDLEARLKESQQRIDVSEISLQEKIDNVSVLENIIQEQKTVLSNQTLATTNQIQELQQIIETNQSESRKQMDKLQLDYDLLQNQLENAQSDLTESLKREDDIKAQLRESTENGTQLENLKMDLESQLHKLRTESAETIEQLKRSERQVKNQLETMEKTYNESSENFNQEKQEAAEREISMKNEKDDLLDKVEKLQIELQHHEEDLETERNLRETERGNMEKKIASLSGELLKEQTQKQDFDKQLEKLETDNIEKNLRLENAKEDKERMIEKIISLEDVIKNNQSQYSTKCRELEQLQSAVLDLGRENQGLQISQERLTNRTWVGDNEAANCHNCSMEFSVLIRKHHCRHCGQVFCQDCSSKSASLTVAKRPVRVCDGCYGELLQTRRRANSNLSSTISLNSNSGVNQ